MFSRNLSRACARGWLIAFGVIAASGAASGQIVPADDVPISGVVSGRVTLHPVRTQNPPNVDGRLDDAVWSKAARTTRFVQHEPIDGAEPSEHTTAFIAYDSANLYLAFHVAYERPEIMRANRVDRDRADFSDDTISVYFDTFLDQQRAYVFSVNAYGVQGDAIVGAGGGGRRGGGGGGGGGVPRGDSSWNALFEAGGRIVADGFTAEMAIPFKSLRYPVRAEGAPHRWGFQIVRRIRAKNETIVWSPVSRDIAGFLPQMGILDGITGLSTSLNLEIQPSFTAFRFDVLDEEVDRMVHGDVKPALGGNFKYGITSNLVADFTVNPDFSQIESDRPQVEINQRFALFFPELRPFFLEGAEIFHVQAPVTPVHTRTIVDPLYGAKVTGKAGNMQIGVLYANDEAATVETDDDAELEFAESARTFIGRVRYDLYAESHVGGIFTERQFLDGSSRLAGIDTDLRIGNTHSIGFRAMRTDHREALGGQPTSGYLLDFGLRKRGRHLGYSLDAFALSPDFKTDVGFVRRTDQRGGEGRIGYQWWPQTWVISWGPQVSYARNYDFDGVLQDEQLRLSVGAEFDRNIRYEVDFIQDMERFEGVAFEKRRIGMSGNINTSEIISFGGGFNWGDEIYFDDANPFLGRESGIRTFINFRPVSRLASNISITRSRFTDPNRFFIPGINEGERDEGGRVFSVNIVRALSTYQFTDRLLFRNIVELDSHDAALGLNLLLTYRVNAGTVFYIGYDDHYRQRDQFETPVSMPGTGYRQTNRAFFLKLQYLFRY